MSSPPDDIHVVSYNVLTPAYCTPKSLPHHRTNDPTVYNDGWRFECLVDKLRPHVANHAIVCLQEVSADWAGRLSVWFMSEGCHFVYRLYGNEGNGYMGVGIAYPIAEYSAVDIFLKRPVDGTWYAPKKEEATGWMATVGSSVASVMRRLVSRAWVVDDAISSPEQDAYLDETRKRYNTVVALRLLPTRPLNPARQRSFVVATYHMPCDFREPDRMLLYAAMASQTVVRQLHNRDGEEEPLVWAGDFNVVPDSPCYRMLTTERSDNTVVVSNATRGRGRRFQETLRNAVDSGVVWTSAYAHVCGKEPDCTTRAHSEWSGEEFQGTLDYILYAGRDQLRPVAVVPVPHIESVLPSSRANEPSDHVLIGATFAWTAAPDDAGV